ncbi:hypothetical protein [Halobaculum sp. EA56]|uniref:hypothetical protein n=1 Tax=Halobaculum sp. EA56 TaxID=3421648 RepID=UPI003EBDDE2C
MASSASSSNASIDTSLATRSAAALTECMVVLPTEDSEVFDVVAASGRTYHVDLRAGVCDCPDALHRDPTGGCKHARRVGFATGRRPIPGWVDRSRLDPLLGSQVSGAPRIERRDGTTEVL